MVGALFARSCIYKVEQRLVLSEAGAKLSERTLVIKKTNVQVFSGESLQIGVYANYYFPLPAAVVALSMSSNILK